MYTFVVTIQWISIVVLFIEVVYIISKCTNRLQGYLLFSCLSTLINNVGYLMEMCANNRNEYIDGLHISYLGRSFIPFALLLFTLQVSNVELKKYITIPLGTIHAITCGMVLTSQYNHLYYSTMDYVEDGLFAHIVCGHTLYYKLYQDLIVIYVIAGLSSLIYAAKKESDKIAKKRLYTVTCSIAAQSIFFILGVFGVSDGYDLTVMGYTLGALIMGIAIFHYDLLDTLELARDFVIDDIPEGVLIYDQNGKLAYINPVAKLIFGAKENGEISGRAEEKLEEAIKANAQIYAENKIYSVEKKALIHKATDRGKVYILVDETEHFRYMDELMAQKELAEEAQKEAESANASKSAFLSVVSHEIRTPMNAVVGMTELLLREPETLTEKQESYLNNIRSSGKALVMIVNDILDQSKIEAGKMELVEEAYELRPMVKDVLMIIENRIGGKPIELLSEISEDVPTHLIGDSLRIRQILINLMNNAVKFTEDGFIKLAITAENRTSDSILLNFSVKDSGQGIKEEDLSRLGEAFSQVDKKKNHSKEGTGLGLSISKDFIAMMGGTLQVRSVYGEGSEFFFGIKQGLSVEEAAKPLKKQVWEEEEFVCPNASILVVDDTDLNLMIVEDMLEPLLLHTDTALSGKDAIERILNNHYDLVFMDYMMPFMDGVETTAKIRSLSETHPELKEYLASLPIVALTGDDSEETKQKFAKAGINDFTEKPVTMKAIKKLLLRFLPDDYIKMQ